MVVSDVEDLRVFICRHEHIGIMEPLKVVRFSLANGRMDAMNMTCKVPSVTRVDF